MKVKPLYQVSYKDLLYTVNAKSAQNACRKAFRYWITRKDLKRQPKSDDSGGFEGVEVERV